MLKVEYKSGFSEDFDFQSGDRVTVVWDVGKMYHGELTEIEDGGIWVVLDDDENKEEFFAFAELQAVTDPDQAYLWTEEWQAGEREADADIKAGRTAGPFKTNDELFKSLDKDTGE